MTNQGGLRGQGRTLTEIALASGMSLTHISRVASGKRRPSIDVARKIADVLDIDLDQLWEMISNDS